MQLYLNKTHSIRENFHFHHLPKLYIGFAAAPETNQAENDIQLILKDFLTKISNMAMVLPPNGW